MRNPGVFVNLLLLAALFQGATALAAGEGYLRYPDIHGDEVVFVAEADLWIAPVNGGSARRLTIHAGSESFPRFSPDGRWIAFTGEYDGNADLFVMPVQGGEPRRLTWHPGRDLALGWSPDGEHVLFLSSRNDPHGSSGLYEVPVRGGDIEQLPLGWATHLDIDADSGQWAFTRTGGGGTWKRYRGGTARTIWVGDPGRADFREITDFDGMNAFPMWHGGRIFFLSDVGGTANLWSMKPDGTDRKQLTHLGIWDARYPSMGPDGRIVFMLAGDVHLFDPAGGKQRKLQIDLPSDRVLTRTRYPDAAQYLTHFDLSPDGERLAVTTRGEIFSVPVDEGVTLPVSRGSGARESWATFDPDGQRLAYFSDGPGEEELRIIDAWGRDEPEVVREANDRGWHYPPVFSPDGEWIAYADDDQTIYIVSASGGKPRRVDRDENATIEQYNWSPDSRWLAYVKHAWTGYGSIYIHDTEAKKSRRVTGDQTDESSPAWDPDGRYLYFLSSRTTNPLLGARDFQNVNIEATRPYLALLREDLENPFAARAGFPPEDDENDEDAEEEVEEDDLEADAVEPIEIDFDGLEDRVVAFPVEAGQYSALDATATHVFYVSMPLIGMADWGSLWSAGEPQASLISFSLEELEAEWFVDGISGYVLSAEAGMLAVMTQPGEIYVLDASAAPDADFSEFQVDLGGVVVELDPRAEWEQIFHEGWRHMRDFYWDPGLGGVNWKAVHDQYAALLPRLATRGDLQDLMAEMIGELSTSHTYVFGGDAGRRVPSRPTGLLGADLVREGDLFRVERIYRGAPADNEDSPLIAPGVNVREGEYILAVNHQAFRDDRPFHAHLEGFAGGPVLLTVNDSPSREAARQVLVVPLRSEHAVRYADWVRGNREQVAAETEGKIGYIHIPDMMQDGMIEFNTWFYPQLDKQGMIVDVRWNGGGFVSQMILERLRRPVISFDLARGGGTMTYPYRTLNGPFVVLLDEHAGSDGDIFPAAVQLEGLAPVIGQRSWGGVVGISGLRPMVDGGLLTQPQAAWWDPERGWGLENRGVEPDIEVLNLPQDLANGIDAQLERAIQEVLRLHAEDPPLEPEFGPVPPRGRDAYKKELSRWGQSR